MKFLRFILFLVYAVLFLLLLLCNRCTIVHDNTEKVVVEKHDTIVRVDTVYRDRDDAVERADSVGGSGRLKITLLWDFPGDIDLHVLQPTGKAINYTCKRDSITGGFLDVDNTNGENAAENIYWENPPNGTYSVNIEYYATKKNHKSGGLCKVVVKKDNTEPKVFDVGITTLKQKIPVCRVDVP